MPSLLVLIALVLLSGCSDPSRPGDVNKIIETISSTMNNHIIRCGDSLYFNAQVENNQTVRYRFRGKVDIIISEKQEYSEADKLNGLQYDGEITLRHVAGVAYNYKSKQWVDVEKPEVLAYVRINKSKNKVVSGDISTCIGLGFAALFDCNKIVNNDVLSCNQLNQLEESGKKRSPPRKRHWYD